MESIINLAIIAITCVVSFMAFNNRALMDRLILWPPAIDRKGEWWRLLSYGLVHADGMHLLFNMVTLYFFGRIMEPLYTDRLGPFGFPAFYAGALLVSILPSFIRHRHDPQYRSLGASGAVSAVLFAFVLFDPWSLIFVFFLPLPAIVYAVLFVGYSIWLDKRQRDNINHSAHLWGAAYGVLFTIIMEPRVLELFATRILQPRFGL